MGSGSFDSATGKFTLFATLEMTATNPLFEQELQRWQNSFRHASKLLYDATDGQMSFGRIEVSGGLTGDSTADVELCENPGASGTTGTIDQPSEHMFLMQDEQRKPFVIVHEFGHYAFDLEDEYRLNDWDYEPFEGVCTNDATGESACIMEFNWPQGLQIDHDGNEVNPGTVSEFCCEANHGAMNLQEHKHHESCWSRIVSNPDYPIIGPAKGERPSGPAPETDPPPMEWIRVLELSRFLIVVGLTPDDSGNVDVGAVAAAIELSFSFLASLDDSETGLVFYGVEANQPLIPLTQNPNPDLLDDILKSFPRIFNDSQIGFANLLTNWIGLLRDPPAANHRIVWLGTDFVGTRNESKTVVPTFRRNRVAVDAAVTAASRNIDALQSLADQTLGSVKLNLGGDSSDELLDVLYTTAQSTLAATDHFSIVSSYRGALPESHAADSKAAAIDRYSPADLKRVSSLKQANRTTRTTYDHQVLIEEGARRAAFFLLRDPDRPVWLYLIKPDGTVVNPKDDRVRFIDQAGSSFQVLTIDNSDQVDTFAGRWTLRVDGQFAETVVPFQLLAASENAALRTELSVKDGHAGKYTINAFVSYRLPIGGLDPVFAEVTELSADGTLVSTKVHPLVPKREQIPNSHEMGELHNGNYSTTITLNANRIYKFRVQLKNEGRAFRIFELLDAGDEKQNDPRIPPFSRLLENYLKTPAKKQTSRD